MAEDLKKIHSYLPKLVEEMETGKLERREFLRIAALLGLSATAAYAIAGLTPLAKPARAATAGGTVRISIRVPALDNPHTYSWVYDSNSTRQACDYLTRTGVDNVTRPWLVEKWEASDDLKTWTLNLRKGVKWSDGEDLVADHAIWNMKRWLDPAVGSSILGLMKGYMMNDDGTAIWDANAIEKVSDYQIRLNARAPQLAVPEHLFHYPALILHPSDNGVFGLGAKGTGAFTMVEYEVGKKAVFERRDGYWGKPAILDRLEFIDHGDDAAAALGALASKQVHGLYEASTTQYAALQKMEHVQVHQISTGQTGVARMQEIHEQWKDPRVRKAMRLALDTEKLVQIAHLGLGAPGEHHHVAPVHPEYAKLPFMKQDIAAAKKLLAEAGYPNGIEAEIVCKKDPDWELISVQAMVQMWKEIGANIKINVLPSAQYWDIWNAPTNPFAFTAWTHRPLGVMVLGLAYRTGVPWNESHWSNAKFDSLLAKAEGTLDVEKRREVMVEIETLMLEEGPICLPLWRAVFTAMDKRLQGYVMHPTNYFFAEDWSLEA
ncbi:MAG: ABC transporter substrate-binding protein [Dongiaceae bacterium]